MTFYELVVHLHDGYHTDHRVERNTQVAPLMAIATSLCYLYHVIDLVLYDVIDGFAYPLMQYNEKPA